MGKCTFKSEWLSKKDKNGYVISEWGRKKSEGEMFCVVCAKGFSIKWGFEAVEQHAASRKHKDECRNQLVSSQLHLSAVRPGVPEETSSGSHAAPKDCTGTIPLYSVRDSATRAELIWVLKTISADFAFEPSYEHIGETFKFMFPNAVPQDFSLSRTKAQYLTTDVLAPYFRKQLLKDFDGAYYTLCYDETTNAASYKELQVAVRYWSLTKNMIVTRHLQTFFMGSATAKDIYSKLDEALDSAQLPRSKLLMLSNDGPNVNKAVTKLMNDYLILTERQAMVDIGTCNIHIVHNAFRKGMAELGDDASNLIFLLHDFFDGWPSRWEDFTKIQRDLGIPNHRFLKHVSLRWLSVESAAARLIEQWPAVTKYFMDFVPKSKSDLVKSSTKYRNIINLLKQETMKAEVMFCCTSARLFTKFTGVFQKEEPLVHVMHSELKTLTRTIMNRVCKSSAPLSLEAFSDGHYIPAREVISDSRICDELEKLSEKEKLLFLTGAKKHFIASCKHLLLKSSLDKPILRNLQCLAPAQRVKEGTHKDIMKVAAALPMDIPMDMIADEWKLLRLEDETASETCRIDTYWNQFFEKTKPSGDPKYPLVTKVVKAALSLSHGSADIERGFSKSGHILTDERARMSERTLNAHLLVKETLYHVYENKVYHVNITQELLQMARAAHVHYKQYCDEQRAIKEKEQKEKEKNEREKAEELERLKKIDNEKDSIQEKEAKLKKLRQEQNEKRIIARTLLSDATKHMKESAEKKDMVGFHMAQLMLEGVEKAMEEGKKKKACGCSAENC